MGKRLWGIILIAIGTGFLLEQLDIIPSFGEALRLYWPSILILIGLSGLFSRRTSKFGSIFLIVIGIFMQVDRLDFINISIWGIFWPVILILVGFRIIFSRDTMHINMKSDYKEENFSKNITTEDTLDEFVLMSGISTRNQSQQFKGGRAIAIMGGMEIDLRNAKLGDNKAMIELNSVMGGIEVYVPDSWRVEASGTPILGGWTDNTKHNTDPDAPVLKIKGFVLLGGIEIK